MKNLIYLLGLALIFSAVARAADDRNKLLSLIGTSDLIVVGTVTESAEYPTAPMYRTGEATIAVERVLKGPEMKEARIRYDTLRKVDPLSSFMPEPQVLEPKMQQLFFLQQGQGGYYLAGTFKEKLLPIGDADLVAALIKEMPVEVSLVEPLPWIAFGLPETVRVRVKNISPAPLQIIGSSLTAYPLSELLGVTANITPKDRNRVLSVLLNPGEESVVEIRALCPLPASCKAFPADTLARFPYCLRAEVTISDLVIENPATPEERARLHMGHRITVATPWVLATIGFPLPK